MPKSIVYGCLGFCIWSFSEALKTLNLDELIITGIVAAFIVAMHVWDVKENREIEALISWHRMERRLDVDGRLSYVNNRIGYRA